MSSGGTLDGLRPDGLRAGDDEVEAEGHQTDELLDRHHRAEVVQRRRLKRPRADRVRRSGADRLGLELEPVLATVSGRPMARAVASVTSDGR